MTTTKIEAFGATIRTATKCAFVIVGVYEGAEKPFIVGRAMTLGAVRTRYRREARPGLRMLVAELATGRTMTPTEVFA